MSDEEIRKAFLNQDWHVFNELAERWFPVILTFLSRWGIPRQAAEDLSQEILLWLLQPYNLAKYDPERASFRTWIHCIAHSRRCDWARRPEQRKNVQPLPDGDESGGIEDRSQEGSAKMELARKERSIVIDEAIAALPEKMRAVLTFDMAGLKDREIGDILSIPNGTVATRKSRALKRIKKHLKKHGYDSPELEDP